MVRRMTDDVENSENKGERIAKVLARAGVASRREVERMIEARRIHVDGKPLETPAFLVTSLKGITVDGEPITEVSETRVWRLHKKRGTLTTHRDPEGRATVFDGLPNHMGRVISVGRLDMNTEGLLLLTNDGELARWLELPANNVLRRYRVRVHGRVNEKTLADLKDGITIEGIHYGEIDAKLERQTGANAWLTVAIREGKNREVRRVMEHLGLAVNRLIRTHYGPFSLGSLPLGGNTKVSEKQLHEVLEDYFKTAGKSVAAPTVKRDPSKWAKAKKDTGNKPGTKWRKKAMANKRKDKEQSEKRPSEKRPSNKKAFDKKTSDQRPANKKPADRRASGKPQHQRPTAKKSAKKQ